MYKVIKKFADLKDKRYIYEIGDVYPRKGYTPNEERIEFLASDQNKLGTPVIEFVPEEVKVEKKEKVSKPKSEKKTK